MISETALHLEAETVQVEQDFHGRGWQQESQLRLRHRDGTLSQLHVGWGLQFGPSPTRDMLAMLATHWESIHSPVKADLSPRIAALFLITEMYLPHRFDLDHELCEQFYRTALGDYVPTDPTERIALSRVVIGMPPAGAAYACIRIGMLEPFTVAHPQGTLCDLLRILAQRMTR